MIAAYSLLWGDVAEYVTLLLIASSHASWTRSALLGYKTVGVFQQPARPYVTLGLISRISKIRASGRFSKLYRDELLFASPQP
jgi:hypothetical protein